MRAGSPEALAESTLSTLPIRATREKVGLPKNGEFDQLLLDCVDASLADLLGTKVRDAAYALLQRSYSLPHDEIPNKADEFGTCLDQVFGRAGKVIGRAIAKRFYQQLGLQFIEKPDYRYQDYIRAVKR